MKFNSTLQSATLISRYKRFLTDIKLADDQCITIHCPNTGSMTGCATSGDQVWYATSANPKRKYPHTWTLNHTIDHHWICINTTLANHVVKEAIEQQLIPELNGYDQLRTEVKYGAENSRIDLLLQHTQQPQNKPDCYIEVKSVTLLGQGGQGYFPDAVSTRGQKHLRELIAMVEAGHRAVLFFLVQHTGIERLSPATHIDPKYSEWLEIALAKGVEILCYRTSISPTEITVERSIDFALNPTFAL